ncbi:MAG: J domain-containing protein [Polyangiaceae bacterium]|nr:J domain-containing protein [Polyangiaceae bacterium]
MEFEDALTLLGVDPTVDDVALRRAYLRAVRRHPPERDAEGFRSVREAYEQLQREMPYRRCSHDAADASDTDAAASPPQSQSQSPPQSQSQSPPQSQSQSPPQSQSQSPPQSQSQSPPQSQSPTPTPEERAQLDASAALSERLESLEPGSEESIAACREAIAESPREAELRWSLIEQLEYAERHAEAEAEQERAHRAKLDGFFSSLLYGAPHRLHAEELERAAEEPELAGAVAAAYVARDQPVRAGKLFTRLIEQDHGAVVGSLDLGACLRALLRLIALGHWKTAERLHAALQRWTENASVADRRFEGLWAAHWLLATELLAVRERVGDELVRAMANALAHDEPSQHAVELTLLRDSSARRARRVLKVLEADAPSLQLIFGASLTPPARAPLFGSLGRFGSLLPIIGVVLASNIARVCVTERTPVHTAPPIVATAFDAGPVATSPSPIALAERGGSVELSLVLRRAFIGLAEQRCDDALAALGEAQALVPDAAPDSELRRAVDLTRERVDAWCLPDGAPRVSLPGEVR